GLPVGGQEATIALPEDHFRKTAGNLQGPMALFCQCCVAHDARLRGSLPPRLRVVFTTRSGSHHYRRQPEGCKGTHTGREEPRPQSRAEKRKGPSTVSDVKRSPTLYASRRVMVRAP